MVLNKNHTPYGLGSEKETNQMGYPRNQTHTPLKKRNVLGIPKNFTHIFNWEPPSKKIKQVITSLVASVHKRWKFSNIFVRFWYRQWEFPILLPFFIQKWEFLEFHLFQPV